MKFFNCILGKKSKETIPPMPSWEAIIEMMHDKCLDAFSDEVTDVIYSKDRSMRYVILKGDSGLLTYQLEAIYQFDEDEWKYICSHDNALPAAWEPYRAMHGNSFFDSMENLLKEIKNEIEYKKYFL